MLQNKKSSVLHKLIIRIVTIVAIFAVVPIVSMVFDNRYIPLIQYPYITVPDRDSHLTGDFFVTTASEGADDRERSTGVFELSGIFDQAQMAYSFVLAALPDPLPVGLTEAELPWMMRGKLQTQGFAFSWQQEIVPHFSFGVLTLAMRSNSYIDFFLNRPYNSSLTDDDVLTLDDVRRSMFATLGLACNHVKQGGLGDTELYLRWADYYDYCLKLRSLQYALRLGTMAPTGVKRNVFQPASIPFGGNGHWGIYGSFDAELELKEDWKVGLLLRGSKRFARTSEQRMPVLHPLAAVGETNISEPDIFGVVVGPARVNPGFTQIFYLYGQWEGIREGLGVRIQYTLINHWKDNWTDERINKTVPVNLAQVEERSKWASEYITLSAFYDFDKTSTERCARPIVRAAWDIPFTLLVGHRFVHSYKVSLGLEFNF